MLVHINEKKAGGIMLIAGSIIILITIFFEHQLGWIGVKRTKEEITDFIFSNWSRLSLIWSWQTIGHSMFFFSYLLLFKKSNGLISLIWSLLILFSLLVVVSMCMTLGSYYPALSVYDQQPMVFDSIAGAIRTLYNSGQFGSVILVIVFLIESFRKDGAIRKQTGLILLVLVIATILIGSLIGIPTKIVGAVWFLLPIFLGYAYWKQ
jgi:phosphatidylglycerophosphatase A